VVLDAHIHPCNDLDMRKLLSILVVMGACTNNSVNSDEQARRAYLGLDKSVSKSLTLAFQGYDATSNANIPTQMTSGDAMPGGTLAISGQVSHGNVNQASMSLDVGMVSYSDSPIVIDDKNTKINVTYNTGTTNTPALNIKLNGSSGNALSGSLVGDYTMTGDLKGTVTLDLTIAGTFTGSGTSIMRVEGSTTITGTVVNSSGGMYTVNVTL
jgi:hypothetical protein